MHEVAPSHEQTSHRRLLSTVRLAGDVCVVGTLDDDAVFEEAIRVVMETV